MEFSLLNLLLVLLVAAIGGAIATRFGYPSLIGEMLAGILFGPMALGWLEQSEGLALLAEIGVFLMMLYIGIEVDHRDLMKASWGGLLAALGSFLVPFGAGFWLVTVHFNHPAVHGMFVGLAMGVTSLATKSRALMELKLLGTRVANVMLAGALVCDTLALVGFAAITGLVVSGGGGILTILLVLVKALSFFGLTVMIGLRVLPVIGKLLRKFGFTERSTNFTLVILVGLVFAEMAEIAGLHSVIGAFIAGLFIREEVLKRKVSLEVAGMVHDVSIGFLAPVFFVMAGFNVDVMVLWTDAIFLVIIISVAMASKIIGAWLFYLPTGRGWREGLVIGAGMNGQGAVAIIIAEIGLQMELIDQGMFSILVFTAFFTTLAEPLFLKLGTGWLRGRDELARADDNRDLVMIAGATPLARLMAKELAVTDKVSLIDNNSNLVRAASMEGLPAIKGNVLNEELFDISGASRVRTFIAMTTNHEVNRIATTQARDMFGVPASWAWPSAAPATGPSSIVIKETMPMDVQAWNEWLLRKEVDQVSFSMTRNQRFETFSDMAASLQVLPLVIERDQRRYPAMIMDELRKGDRVIGIRRQIHHINRQDIFEDLVRQCPVLDVQGPVEAADLFQKAAERLSGLVGIEAEALASMLMERERDSTTVVAPGVAIPHVIVDGDQPLALLVARTRDGAAFLDPKAQPVQFTFVIVGARSARNLHLRILSAIAQLFQDPGFEDMLLAAPDADAIRQAILSTRRRKF